MQIQLDLATINHPNLVTQDENGSDKSVSTVKAANTSKKKVEKSSPPKTLSKKPSPRVSTARKEISDLRRQEKAVIKKSTSSLVGGSVSSALKVKAKVDSGAAKRPSTTSSLMSRSVTNSSSAPAKEDKMIRSTGSLDEEKTKKAKAAVKATRPSSAGVSKQAAEKTKPMVPPLVIDKANKSSDKSQDDTHSDSTSVTTDVGTCTTEEFAMMSVYPEGMSW